MVKTCEIEARDLQNGHIWLPENGRPARIGAVVMQPHGYGVTVEAWRGHPLRAEYIELSAGARVRVTQKSHDYVRSPAKEADLEQARGIVTAKKAALTPKARTLAAGASVVLHDLPLPQKEVAVFRRLPGLRLSVEDGRLSLSECPQSMSRGPQQSYAALEQTAQSLGLKAVVDANSPPGVVDVMYVRKDPVGLRSRIDGRTGAVATARDDDIAQAQPTLDIKEQALLLRDGVDQTRRITPAPMHGLPAVDDGVSTRARHRQLSLGDVIEGKFAGVGQSDDPERSRVYLRSGLDTRYVVVSPKDIPDGLKKDTSIRISAKRSGLVIDSRQKSGPEIGLSHALH